MILYAIDQFGGFTAGDTESGYTSYAYPSSEHAQDAKHDPEDAAMEMIASELNWTRPEYLSEITYDILNWKRIDEYSEGSEQTIKEVLVKLYAKKAEVKA